MKISHEKVYTSEIGDFNHRFGLSPKSFGRKEGGIGAPRSTFRSIKIGDKNFGREKRKYFKENRCAKDNYGG
jgi:hypothetical protein